MAVLGLAVLPYNLGAWITYGWPLEGSKTTPIEMWVFASTFIEMALSILLLISSIGAYRFARWGREGLLLWSGASLLYGIAGIYFWGRFLLPWLRSEYPTMRGPDEIAGLVGWAISSVFAVVVFYYIRRPSVRGIFELAETHEA